jgi:hypothetical protein
MQIITRTLSTIIIKFSIDVVEADIVDVIAERGIFEKAA